MKNRENKSLTMSNCRQSQATYENEFYQIRADFSDQEIQRSCEFVIKLKDIDDDDNRIFDQFVEVLESYQSGSLNYIDLKTRVTSIISCSDVLVKEFNQFLSDLASLDGNSIIKEKEKKSDFLQTVLSPGDDIPTMVKRVGEILPVHAPREEEFKTLNDSDLLKPERGLEAEPEESMNLINSSLYKPKRGSVAEPGTSRNLINSGLRKSKCGLEADRETSRNLNDSGLRKLKRGLEADTEEYEEVTSFRLQKPKRCSEVEAEEYKKLTSYSLRESKRGLEANAKTSRNLNYSDLHKPKRGLEADTEEYKKVINYGLQKPKRGLEADTKSYKKVTNYGLRKSKRGSEADTEEYKKVTNYGLRKSKRDLEADAEERRKLINYVIKKQKRDSKAAPEEVNYKNETPSYWIRVEDEGDISSNSVLNDKYVSIGKFDYDPNKAKKKIQTKKDVRLNKLEDELFDEDRYLNILGSVVDFGLCNENNKPPVGFKEVVRRFYEGEDKRVPVIFQRDPKLALQGILPKLQSEMKMMEEAKKERIKSIVVRRLKKYFSENFLDWFFDYVKK